MIQVKLTVQEAQHLLAYNTGFLSCPISLHPGSTSSNNGDCQYYKSAREKIELAIKNALVNGE